MKKSATSGQPLVSIVILNWNRPHDTLECVLSVKKQTYKKIEVIVLDNGSIDNSKELLKKLDGITLIENPTNRGFTGGHIDGAKHAKGKYILVLNNDAVVDKDYVKNAVNILESDNQIAVVGGRSYQWETPDQIYQDTSPYFAFQTINRFSMEGIFARTDAGFNHEVNWVSGSAMVIRKAAIEKSGYFYDPMFAYYEESDLFARLQAHDYTIVYSPSLKIWHKNGASSSNYFQYYQLFKNRFVYGVRNLQSRDLARFLKSYTKTTARGSYHHLFRKPVSDDEKTMNKALHNALGHSLATWPKWIASRKSVRLKDSNGYNLSDRLKIEQTGISFVCDISERTNNIKHLAQFIETVSYKHFNSQIVLVCDINDIPHVRKQLAELSLDVYNISIAGNTHQSTTHPLNLGWLSADREFVWFISSSSFPTIETIVSASLSVHGKPFDIYIDHVKDKTRDVNFCTSRQLLGIYGGIDTESPFQSVAHLSYFAKKLHKSADIHTSDDELTQKEQSLTSEIKARVRYTVFAYNDQKRKTRRYQKLLERYYRLYQLHNLSVWLFVGDIPYRHKLARIRNSLRATLLLNRKDLALELKHIGNEVIKSKRSGFDREERELFLTAKAEEALEDDRWKNTPLFIICRDRVTPLSELVSWLEKAGLKNIIFVDNDSAYSKLMEYFEQTPYQVIRTGKNIGHTVVWAEGIAKTLFPNQYYIVTDPDVIPDKKAPLDSVAYFYELHKKYVEYQKVGFGLQIDDLPDHYKLKKDVIKWEEQFWQYPLEENVYEAGVDTTFALYKPYTDYYILHPSIRTGRPYTARHLPWYIDSSKIDEEEAYYRMHASNDITSWNTDEILERYQRELEKNK